jgi:hypothetical protein
LSSRRAAGAPDRASNTITMPSATGAPAVGANPLAIFTA